MFEFNERPLVQALMEAPQTGLQIEAASFAKIDQEAPSHAYDPDAWEVVRRMIHTTADFGIMHDVRFSPNAIKAGVQALKTGSPITMDANMIRAGISLARLQKVYPGYDPSLMHCYVADADVASQARQHKLPRSLFAVRKAKALLDQGIAVFGNAPVGLLEMNRMIIEENLKPHLVIGLPVGFVHVEESKRELMGLDVPWIVLAGRRGGSPLAVSVIHAIATLAAKDNPCDSAK